MPRGRAEIGSFPSPARFLIRLLSMELTKLERLILANQYRILEKLDKVEADTYRQNATILESGYTRLYDGLFSGYDEDLSLEECEEVVDVLSMYRALRVAQRDLPNGGGATVADITFRGFDGNEESKQYAYTLFMVEDQRKWGELAGVDLNSHAPMLDRYRPMVQRWKSVERPYELTEAELAMILGR